MNSRTIVVPVDLSDCTQHVVDQAAELAAGGSRRVVLVHVVEPPVGLAPDTLIQTAQGEKIQTVHEYLESDAEQRLAPFVQRVERHGIEAESRIARGEIVDAILATSDRENARMIVMGSHGRTGASRWVFGSVAERVLRQARCPVTVVRTQHQPQCAASSCAWCDSGVSAAQRQVAAELDG